MTLPQGLHELIEKFKQNRDQYSSQDYKEAELRREFIDPLFEILGWDMTNKKGAAEQYKDVKYEPSLEVEGGTKAPDYAFRIGGTVKFFMEAKKPSVNISQDSSPAFQLRRYAWSQDIPLSILTNFESIYVYDGRFKPHKADNPSNARTMRIDIDELENRWDEFSNIFSCESVLKGSFDRYAVDTKGKKGTSKVNDEFLKEIEGWREAIAKNIATRNAKPGIDELNYSVQKIIDRIIFLRICEDRGTEPPEQLRELIKKAHIYRRLVDLFQLADAKYNSGLFHFQADKKRATHPDEITPKLKIDDDVLEKIIGGLYYPDSPYQFDVIPADILGQVYEQFLGKVIRLTEGHHAKVEEKPEVKKAGGVYYTPAYIVNYIVENTVGVLCKGKSPEEMGKLRILDPACGSGSFLIVAYERMLKEHLDWYVSNEPKKRKENVFQGQKGDWRLTLKEKKRILLNNIYGVDIDGQAVEVTKLNLLLKALEGESKESVDNVNKWFREPALPDLENNIKCGNSLVDFDIEEMLKDLSPEERQQELNRIKPFSWNNEFPQILKDGGFDTVIGNPPYGYMIPDVEKRYYDITYQCQDYQKDLYLLFIEKYRTLLKLNGLLGIIVSNTWLQSVTYQKIRMYFTNNYRWIRILHLPEKVFHAVVDTHVLIFEKYNKGIEGNDEIIIDVRKGKDIEVFHRVYGKLIPKNGEPINIVETSDSLVLFKKTISNSERVMDICDVYNGIKPFEKGKGIPPQTEKIMIEKPYVIEGARPNKLFSPLLRGSLINRYCNFWKDNYWIKYGEWLAAPRDSSIFTTPEKILVRQTGDSIIATLVDSRYYARDNLHILLPKQQSYNLFYILGIINSKLIDFIYTCMNPEKGEALAQVKKYHIEQLPIRPINFSDPTDKARHDKMVSLVERMLKLHKDLQENKTPDAKTQLERTIEATDKEIDALVYELYGLTEEEIKIVEGTQ